MTTTILAVEYFDADAARAQEAANAGPVAITEHGEAAYVLISIDEYRRLTAKAMSLAQSDPTDF